MFYTILYSLISILSILIIPWYIHTLKFRSLKDVPGPMNVPLFGIGLIIISRPHEFFKILNEMTKKYSPTCKMWLGPKDCYVATTDPEFIKMITMNPKLIKKSVDYEVFRPFIKNGLVISEGDYWHTRRRIVAQAFRLRVLESFLDVFDSASNILVERLKCEVDKDEFDVFDYTATFALDVICETSLGVSVNFQLEEHRDFVNALYTIIRLFFERMFSPWKRFEILYKTFSPDYKLLEECIKVGNRFTQKIIEERRKKLMEDDATQSKTDELGFKRKQIFLDSLLHARIGGNPLSDEEIQQEVNTIIIAGHDTSRVLLSFAMYELSRNPEVQDKAFAEAKEILKNNNMKLTLKELDDMTYIECVLKETLRLYPSVAYAARQLEEDINYKGTIYPKDTNIVLFIYGMQRREDLFPNAEKFDPDRFLSGEINENPDAYIPFSSGIRNCVGYKFGTYEIKYALAKIVLNYEILPAAPKYDVQLSNEVIIQSANGIHVKLRNRIERS